LLAGMALGAALPWAVPVANAADKAEPRSRTFEFTYAATVTGLAPGKTARIWVPVAPVTREQDVTVIAKQLPGTQKVSRDPTYNNIILYVEARANKEGKVPFKLTYRVTRREVRTDAKTGVAKKETKKQRQRFLQPDALVPIKGKPLELVKHKDVPADPLEAARLFYEVINKHMKYDKTGTGWGRGDAAWACANGKGNCSDFHSLFISLARAHKIPAQFEMGFPLPEKHGAGDIPGYHCWAWFQPKDMGWIPVDISEANKNPKMADYYFGNLTEDRVLFSSGRDVQLVPRQAGKPLNFFIYPYVEVDGKSYDKVERKFAFKDVPAKKTDD
jgi:transglutaminase-like putative cysteine protease